MQKIAVSQFARRLARPFRQWRAVKRGFDLRYSPSPNRVPRNGESQIGANPSNDLLAFFENKKVGAGIWKWRHYFDIYDRHLSRFRNTEAHILEIGVYSGGSLEMWRDYFGLQAHLYGIDIEDACRKYDGHVGAKVFIGDQGDRAFWRRFRQSVPRLDVLIDDGSHYPPHQMVTAEEILPHLQLGGVYICEDVHGGFNRFASYVQGMAHKLSDGDHGACTPFQAEVASIHQYPFMTVIEKNRESLQKYNLERHGSEWEHFWWEKEET